MSIPLGRVTLLAPVAKGGMGQIWKAVEPIRGVPIAVKLVSAEHREDPEYRKSFQHEVRAVARLDHPGIVVVHDVGSVTPASAELSGGRLIAGTPYLAMEWCSSTLKARMKNLNWRQLREVATQLLDALGHAHARGVVHRDLKPSNILLATARDKRPGLKLSDFGIAHARGDRDRSVSGTPPYMAPEQIRGSWRDIGPWTDLYALGCVLWRLATGRTPFSGLKGKHLLRAHLSTRPGEFNPQFEVPEDLEFWIRRLLEKDPKRRFQRASQAVALLDILAPAVEVAEPEPVPEVQPEALSAHDISTLRAPSMGQRQRIPSDWRPLHGLAATLAPDLGGHRLLGLRVLSFVGRDAERDALWAGLIRCRDQRELELIGLRGAPGVGRSRLLDWIAERSHELAGCETLHVACNEPGDPIQRAMVSLLRIGGLDREAIAKRIKSLLRRVDERAREGVLDFLADGSLPEGSRSTFRALTLEAMAEEVRLVVTLDELQDHPGVLHFLKFLIARQAVRPSPLFIIATTDVDGLDLPGTWFDLAPFSQADMRTLLTQVQLSPALIARVSNHAAGNLSEAVQLVDRWARSGKLTFSDEGFRLVGEPETPRALAGWSSRLDLVLGTLPPGSLHVLELAAVLGMHVDALEWQRVSDYAGRTQEPHLVAFNPKRARTRTAVYEALVDHGLARDTPEGWAFANAAFRHAVMARSDEGGRTQAHHRVVATGLRSMGVSDPVRLGEHLVGGGYVHEGLDCLTSAIEPTLQRQGPTQALALLAQCEAARDDAELPPNDPLSLMLLGRRAQLLLAAGRSEAAVPHARRAMEEAALEGLREISARAARVLGLCHLQQLRWSEAEAVARKGLAVLEITRLNAMKVQLQLVLVEALGNLPDRDPTEVLKNAPTLLGPEDGALRREVALRMAHQRADWESVLTHTAEGLSEAIAGNHLPAQRRWLGEQATAWRHLQRPNRARKALTEALEISRLLGDASWPSLLARLVQLSHTQDGAEAAHRVLRKEARRMERLDSIPLHVPLFLAAAAVAADLRHWTDTEHYLTSLEAMGDQLPPTAEHWRALAQTGQATATNNPLLARTAWCLALGIAERSGNPAWRHQATAALSALDRIR